MSEKYARVIVVFFNVGRATLVEYSLSLADDMINGWAQKPIASRIPEKGFPAWLDGWWEIISSASPTESKDETVVIVPVFADCYLRNGQLPLMQIDAAAGAVLGPISASEAAYIVGSSLYPDASVLYRGKGIRGCALYSPKNGNTRAKRESHRSEKLAVAATEGMVVRTGDFPRPTSQRCGASVELLGAAALGVQALKARWKLGEIVANLPLLPDPGP